MINRRSILSSVFLLALSLSFTVGCSNPTSETKPPKPQSIGSVKLGFSNWYGWLPWQVSRDKDIFQTNKIDVDLKWFDDYSKSVTALNTGAIDGNSQTLTETI
jgi:NitT/TauT family transport system substrate-binding protein